MDVVSEVANYHRCKPEGNDNSGHNTTSEDNADRLSPSLGKREQRSREAARFHRHRTLSEQETRQKSSTGKPDTTGWFSINEYRDQKGCLGAPRTITWNKRNICVEVHSEFDDW